MKATVATLFFLFASLALAADISNDGYSVRYTPIEEVTPDYLPKTAHLARFDATFNAIMAKRPKPKGEFETSEQFEKRLDAFESQPYAGKTRLSDVHWFRLPSRINMHISYSADREQFEIALETARCADDERGFNMGSKITPNGQYTATNGFGAKFLIAKANHEMDCLGVGDDAYEEKTLFARVEPPLAKKVKPHLAVYVFGEIRNPYAGRFSERMSPTIHFRHDIESRTRQVFLRPHGVAVVNQSTGEILSRIPWTEFSN